MPTTIKGIYENGKIRLLEKPPKNLGTFEVYIQFSQFPSIPKESVETKPIKPNKFDPEKFRKVVDKTFGAVPDLPDGIKYENQIRNKMEKEFKNEW